MRDVQSKLDAMPNTLWLFFRIISLFFIISKDYKILSKITKDFEIVSLNNDLPLKQYSKTFM